MAVVTLKYGGTSPAASHVTGPQGQATAGVAAFTADPPVSAVSPGESISFHLSEASPKGDIVITFDEPELFSAPEFKNGELTVTLKANLDHTTFYKCELFVNGKLIGAGHGHQGGGIEPSGHTHNA